MCVTFVLKQTNGAAYPIDDLHKDGDDLECLISPFCTLTQSTLGMQTQAEFALAPFSYSNPVYASHLLQRSFLFAAGCCLSWAFVLMLRFVLSGLFLLVLSNLLLLFL